MGLLKREGERGKRGKGKGKGFGEGGELESFGGVFIIRFSVSFYIFFKIQLNRFGPVQSV